MNPVKLNYYQTHFNKLTVGARFTLTPAGGFYYKLDHNHYQTNSGARVKVAASAKVYHGHHSVGVPPSSVVVDNGFDPVLGPPFAPVNYQLTATTDVAGTHLTWTVPDLFISADAALYGPGVLAVLLTSYTVTPANPPPQLPGGAVAVLYAHSNNGGDPLDATSSGFARVGISDPDQEGPSDVFEWGYQVGADGLIHPDFEFTWSPDNLGPLRSNSFYVAVTAGSTTLVTNVFTHPGT